MARVYIAVTPETDPTAAKTFLEIMAAAEKPFRVLGWFLTAATTTSAVIEVHLLRITASGTGTALTPAQTLQGDPAFSGTAEYNHSVEPTAGTIFDRRHVNLLAGVDIIYPENEQLWVPGATNEGAAIELIDDPNQVIIVGMRIEEMG